MKCPEYLVHRNYSICSTYIYNYNTKLIKEDYALPYVIGFILRRKNYLSNLVNFYVQCTQLVSKDLSDSILIKKNKQCEKYTPMNPTL